MGYCEDRGNGHWRLVVSCGFDGNGKRMKKARTVTAKDEDEARRLLAKFEEELESGLLAEGAEMRLSHFVNSYWLPKYAEEELKKKTIHRYKEMLEQRILPIMGHLKLGKILPTDIRDCLNEIRRAGKIVKPTKKQKAAGEKAEWKPLAERTILHHFRLISAILTDAVEWMMIKDNPAERVKPPKAPKARPKFYDEDTFGRMLDALATEPLKYQVLVQLDYVAGLREAELYGLEWDDIDFAKKQITIRRTSQYLPGVGVYDETPKSDEGFRVIAVGDVTLDLLAKYQHEQNKRRIRLADRWPKEWSKAKRLFTSWDGRPAFPKTMSTWFPKFLKRHGLPHLNFHGVRHTAATHDIADGAPLVNVQAKLGHADLASTKVYVHAMRNPGKAMAERADERLLRNRGKADRAEPKK